MRLSTVVAGISCVLIARAGQAASGMAADTSLFRVALTLQADCSITSGVLNFGSQSNFTNGINQSAQLSVTCSNNAPYSIGLDAGNVNGSTINGRLLQSSSGDTVQYQLYKDASRSEVWGNTAGTDALTGVGNGAAQMVPIYGQIGARQQPAEGAYSATVTATVSF
ncbi:Csu type fimbrial protein [Amantichitinum ursilacus]|uniref:Spore Coat Protein U domain protein n=1 Tax=Amantichitinum ursilacus TaxID=857265 RepID=A0A0N1JRN1_9NEIS|nr:spore coat U domain-containing protein [Amantichitinum ursilacus]KPC49543.1 Spore Coat Protein U domain protein [Amantichitinum ursilacus]